MNELAGAIRKNAEKNRDHLAGLISALVRFPSYPGESEDIQRYLQGLLENLGLQTHLIKVKPDRLDKYKGFSRDGFSYDRRFSLVGLKRGTSPGIPEGRSRSIILNGHVDIVPPGDLSCWHDHPLSGKYENGRVFGRGALDMKGGLAAAITAIKILEDMGLQNKGDIIIATVCGEETGGCGAFALIEAGLRADGCLILEPTDLKICHMQSGCHTFKIILKGRSVHACMANRGVNVIDKFYHIYQVLQDLNRRRHERFAREAASTVKFYENRDNIAPFNIGTLSAGEWPSSVPDRLEAHGRIGIFPGESVEEMHAEFEAAVRSAVSSDSWLMEHSPLIEWYEGLFEPVGIDIDSDLVHCLNASHREALGRDVQFEAATYGSDMRIFNLYGGIPVLLYGPGNVSEAHTVNESIEVDAVIDAVCTIVLMLINWCGVE